MEITPENYDAVLDVNLRGTLYCSQAVIPHMRSRKQGKIVNLSSVSAQRGGGIFGGPHYSAAKAGILGLTKAMARELAPDNVRVNAICPGFIATDITGGLLTPEKLEEIKTGIPMFISGGSNVYPREIEEKLLAHPDISEAAIVGVPDPVWGEVGIAVCVARGGAPVDATALREWLDGKIARYKLPKKIVFWSEMPKSAYGKIAKKLIREELERRGELDIGSGGGERRSADP